MESKKAQKSMEALQSAGDTALQRYQWIAPLLEKGLTPSERSGLRRKIADFQRRPVKNGTRYSWNCWHPPICMWTLHLDV